MELLDRVPIERAYPAVLEDPFFRAFLPVRLGREYPAGDQEGFGIELEHRNIGEVVLVGIEKLVVVDAGSLPEYPLAVRTQERLRRLAFDGLEQCFLPLVRIGQIEL